MAQLDFIPLGNFEITYLDGHTETARSNFGAILELETEFADVDKALAAKVTIKALWLYLGRPKDTLEAWATTVHNFEMVSADADPSRPTAGGE